MAIVGSVSLDELESDSWTGEHDLPIVACHAAIEIDDLHLNRQPIELESINRLVALISESIPQTDGPSSPNWLHDPSTVVVVNRAINDALPSRQISTVTELVKEASRIISGFAELIDDPATFRQQKPEALIEMRAFCLALSRRASAAKKSPHIQTPEHRFRR
jgi:hypothetical protein